MLSNQGIEKVFDFYKDLVVNPEELKLHLEWFFSKTSEKGSAIRVEEGRIVVAKGFSKTFSYPIVRVIGQLKESIDKNPTLIIEGENIFS